MLVSATLAQQSSTPAIALPGSQSPFQGSEQESKPTSEVVQLSLDDAINRGLRANLGLLLAGDQTLRARSDRWRELSALLPNVSARIQEDVQTQSLAALGFSKLFPVLGVPGANLPRIVPAF